MPKYKFSLVLFVLLVLSLIAHINYLHLTRLAVEAKAILFRSSHKVKLSTQARFFEQTLANLATNAVVRDHHLLTCSCCSAIQALGNLLDATRGVEVVRKVVCDIILRSENGNRVSRFTIFNRRFQLFVV